MTVICQLKNENRSAIFKLSETCLPATDQQMIRLTDALNELAERVGSFFARPEPRLQAMRYVAALLSKGRRKNSWRIAEIAGDLSPWRTQRLLNRARWDADAVKDAVRGYLAERLGHPHGVLVLGETGVIKKGSSSVAVARQYTETTGRVENCQVGVSATYVTARGHAIVDHELYLPKSWTDDPTRCRKAGVPLDRIAPYTKPELARNMIQRFRTTDLPVWWVTGGVEYGRDESLRSWLESRRISYVLTVPTSHPVVTQLANEIPAGRLGTDLAHPGWRRYRTGAGTATVEDIGDRSSPRKASAESDWARLDVTLRGNDGVRAYGAAAGFARTLLIRRRPGSSRSTCYLAHAPTFTAMDALVAAAQAQQSAQDCLLMAQEQVSLGEYEVRNWTAWHRHMALAELALAALAVSR